MVADEKTFSKLHVHGGKIDWVQYLTEEANYKKVQGLRREWRETHWRARNPNAEGDPPTHKWYTFGQAIDAATVRASPPELSDDEHDKLKIGRSRQKKKVSASDEDCTDGGEDKTQESCWLSFHDVEQPPGGRRPGSFSVFFFSLVFLFFISFEPRGGIGRLGVAGGEGRAGSKETEAVRLA